ncbi:ATP-binding protein [Streptomyces sp. NPDC004980]
MTVRYLDQWGFPSASEVSHAVALVVAELAANAVRHGRVRGRNFLLAVTHEVAARHIRVEVSDARPELPPTVPPRPADDEESGRGLLLVGALATRWGALPRTPVGKTVWPSALWIRRLWSRCGLRTSDVPEDSCGRRSGPTRADARRGGLPGWCVRAPGDRLGGARRVT